MNVDIRIKTSYPDHPKTLKLKKLLGPEGPLSHIFLLCYVARVIPSGELKHMDAQDIAAVSRWTGDPQQFVVTLLELELLDRRGDTYVIHNWQKHNYFAMTAPIRSEVARRNVNKRWRKKNKVKQDVNTDGITNGITNGITDSNAGGNTDSNTPSPSPSPSPKERKNIYGEFENVKLTTEEYEKLVLKITQPKTDKFIKDLSVHMASKGVKYDSHYATILVWVGLERKDEDKFGI